MRPIKKPKPLRNTKQLLNSFNADTLFGMVTELPQSYNHLFDFANFFIMKIW